MPNDSRTLASSELTEPERRVLRELGSLCVEMPPVEERASTRTKARVVEMLDSALSLAQAASRLGLSSQEVRRQLAQRRLVGARTVAGWRLPLFQFRGDRVLRGFDRVLAALPAGLDPLAVAAFLDHPSVDLCRDGEPTPPAAWLEAGGDIERVAALAASIYVLP